MVPVSGLACLAKSHLGNILRFKCRDNYDQGALKHGRGNDNEGPDLCVMRVPASHLVSKVQILFVLIKNGGSK